MGGTKKKGGNSAVAGSPTMKRYNYDTSSSESFDLTGESDISKESSSPPHQSLSTPPPSSSDRTARRRIEVRQIEVVNSSRDDTASLLTDASGMSMDEPSSPMIMMRRPIASDASTSPGAAAPLPPSLHRDRTAPTSNKTCDKSTKKTPSARGHNKNSKKRLIPPTRKATPLHIQQQQQPQNINNVASKPPTPISRFRKPSPCPVNDQPNRPERKETPGYAADADMVKSNKKKKKTVKPPTRVPSDTVVIPSCTASRSPTKVLSPTLKHSNQTSFSAKHKNSSSRSMSNSWKSIDFSGETAKPSPKMVIVKPPLAPSSLSIGQRRWREDGSLVSAAAAAAEDDIESQYDDDGESAVTSSAAAFTSDSRRISSLTFEPHQKYLHQAPHAPGETTVEDIHNNNHSTQDPRRDITFDGSQLFEEHALNEIAMATTSTETKRSHCGQTMPKLVYEDIYIGEAAMVDDASSSPYQKQQRLSTSSRDWSHSSTLVGSAEVVIHREVLASMTTVPEVEMDSVPAPNYDIRRAGLEEPNIVTPSSSWRGLLSSSQQSSTPPHSSQETAPGENHFSKCEQNPNKNHRPNDDHDGLKNHHHHHHHPGRSIRSFVATSLSSLVLPVMNLALESTSESSSLDNNKVEKAAAPENIKKRKIRPCVIYLLIISCTTLIGVIIFMSILLANKDDSS